MYASPAQAKKNIVHAVVTVAARLGNTPAICRKCYVHPAILDGYLDGSLLQTLAQQIAPEEEAPLTGLRAEEVAVLAFLQQRLVPVSPQQQEAA
jgi:DNA topoisomerase-1